jgi:DNA-binding CsgD family transcriptional regulator
MDKGKIHEAIRNYHWMIRLLVQRRLEVVGGSAGLTGRYGIESTLPGTKEPGDPVYQEMLRIEKYEKKSKRMRDKVLFLQKHSQAVTNDRDRVILDFLLDGMSLRDIALELDMSMSGVNHRKNAIVEKIYQDAQMEQMEQKKIV